MAGPSAVWGAVWALLAELMARTDECEADTKTDVPTDVPSVDGPTDNTHDDGRRIVVSVTDDPEGHARWLANEHRCVERIAALGQRRCATRHARSSRLQGCGRASRQHSGVSDT